MKRDIGFVNDVHRTHDGELVVNVDLRNGGLIHGLPNTVSNFQMDEEVVVVTLHRAEADELWNDIGRVAEIVERDFSVEDAKRLWKLAEQFKPDEPVPFLQERTVAA